MKLVLTKRGQKRIASNRKYLEDNFYLETGRRFEDNALDTHQRYYAATVNEM